MAEDVVDVVERLLSSRMDGHGRKLLEHDHELDQIKTQLAESREETRVMTARFDLMAEAFNKTTAALRLGIVTFLLTAAGVLYFGTP